MQDDLIHEPAELIDEDLDAVAGGRIESTGESNTHGRVEQPCPIATNARQKRERRLVDIAKLRVPGQARCCLRHDLASQLVAHLHVDHRDMLTARRRGHPSSAGRSPDNRANVACCSTSSRPAGTSSAGPGHPGPGGTTPNGDRMKASLCQEVPSVLFAACEMPFGRCVFTG